MTTIRPDARRGATAVEYALLAALIAAMIVGAVYAFGGGVSGLFEQANDSVGGAINP